MKLRDAGTVTFSVPKEKSGPLSRDEIISDYFNAVMKKEMLEFRTNFFKAIAALTVAASFLVTPLIALLLVAVVPRGLASQEELLRQTRKLNVMRRKKLLEVPK